MIVWAVAFAGLIWCWYMESERHRAAVERRQLARMAYESREKDTEMMRLERRKEKISRAARWTQKTPRLAGRG